MAEQEIHIAAYDYPLPACRIAQFPLSLREAAKLLVYDRGTIRDAVFSDLPSLLSRDTLLVLNNTRVIHARLRFRKATGAQIEVFLLEPSYPADYEQAFHAVGECAWQCLVGNRKKWKGEVLTLSFPHEGREVHLRATYQQATGTAHTILFAWDDDTLSWAEVVDRVGTIPLPPYLNRAATDDDKETYQTVYAAVDGSVAAPTAGLHFSPALLAEIDKAGIAREEVTLHVGAGTFLPVSADEIHDHTMHAETIAITRATIERLREYHSDITAVGTTTVRTLESLYHLGVKVHHAPALPPAALHIAQWEPYATTETLSAEEALAALAQYMDNRGLATLHTTTQMIIIPSYRYRLVKALITNFHQPRSTLLLLVAALIGEKWRDLYDHALSHDYRFLSYGDACLLAP